MNAEVFAAVVRRLACAMLVAGLVGAGIARADPVVPDTPAGRTLSAWLDAFNSGDQQKLAAYVSSVDPSESVGRMTAFRTQTGGFRLQSIQSSEPLHIRFRLEERSDARPVAANLVVKDGKPAVVAMFVLRAPPPGVALEDVRVDPAMARRVVDGVGAQLDQSYVDAATATKMVATLHARQSAGAYKDITDGDQLAALLTDDLRAVSHDLHLRVDFGPFKSPPFDTPSPAALAQMKATMLKSNCAFDKVEILPGNIGYVKFDGFAPVDVCAPTAAAAMAFVAHVDALIFDLRENTGGDPAMVSFIASYLFDEPTHLNDFHARQGDTTTQFWTLSYLPGERITKQPVYVLTSGKTFSGAEEFCYDLKNLKRGTIVGERTGGGAHPVRPVVVADYFILALPAAEPINPISKTNWEGTGVEPDVKAPAADALRTAQQLAAAAVAPAGK